MEETTAVHVDITISITPDDRCSHWAAHLNGASGTSGWHRTPEAAVIALLEKLRGEYSDLIGRAARRPLEPDDQHLLVWLIGLFR